MQYLVLAGLVLLTGCVNLSKQNHMRTSEINAEHSDSSCGYSSFADIGQFGSENKAVFAKGDIQVSFCSYSYYSKIIATGFIIPFIPFNGRARRETRWVQVSNLSEEYDLYVEAPLQFCKERYPSMGCGVKENGSKSRISLKQGESGWMALPDLDEYQLRTSSNKTTYVFTFKKSTAFSWWSIPV